jgi:hypothetical protein
MLLVTGEPRNATVRAVGDVMVLREELAARMGKRLEERHKNWEGGVNRAEAESRCSTSPGAGEGNSLVRRIRHFFGHSE